MKELLERLEEKAELDEGFRRRTFAPKAQSKSRKMGCPRGMKLNRKTGKCYTPGKDRMGRERTGA